MAASALSASLEVFGKEAWPISLQRFGSYTEADLAPCRDRLRQLQATQVRLGWLAGRWLGAVLGAVCLPRGACAARAKSHFL